MLEHHPIHVRRKIALGVTIGVGALLIGAMVLWYRHHALQGTSDSRSVIKNFYNTISDGAQSFLPGK